MIIIIIMMRLLILIMIIAYLSVEADLGWQALPAFGARAARKPTSDPYSYLSLSISISIYLYVYISLYI